MKLIYATFILSAVSLWAGDGKPDVPTRFSGIGVVEGPIAWPFQCGIVAFRSEDLSDPKFVNRVHIIVQFSTGCPQIPTEVIEGPVMFAALPDGRMQVMVREWNLLLLPTDDVIRKFMITASQSANGGFEIRNQKLSINPWAADTYEFLVEEPRV